MSIIGDVGSWSRSQSTRRKSRSVHSSFRFSDSHNDLTNVRNNATRGTINSVKCRSRKEASISSSGTNNYDLRYSSFETFTSFLSSQFIYLPSYFRFRQKTARNIIHTCHSRGHGSTQGKNGTVEWQ